MDRNGFDDQQEDGAIDATAVSRNEIAAEIRAGKLDRRRRPGLAETIVGSMTVPMVRSCFGSM